VTAFAPGAESFRRAHPCRRAADIEEALMNIGRVVVAAMALAFGSSVDAQVCSGGPDGGMDAAGVQCNDAGRTQAPPPPQAQAMPTRPAALVPVALVPHLQRASLREGRALAAPTPASRTFVAPAPRPPATLPGARHASTCSGGPNGGADATGNQCNAP
jgi:hypothetical protein